jgi:dihydrofolate synthase/folylpolyglutamate synthase
VILVDTTRDLTPDTRLGLRGPHQLANAWVAAATLKHLPRGAGLGEGLPLGEEVPASFADAYIPARFDVRGKWIFDVAHNPDGMRVLVDALVSHRPPRPVHALVGIRNDKDWRPMLQRLGPAVDRLVLTVPPSIPVMQRWSVDDFSGQAVHFEPDFDAALREAQDGAATVLVTGSFHTVGDALSRLPGFAPVG